MVHCIDFKVILESLQRHFEEHVSVPHYPLPITHPYPTTKKIDKLMSSTGNFQRQYYFIEEAKFLTAYDL